MQLELNWKCPADCWSSEGQCHVRLELHKKHAVRCSGLDNNGKETVTVKDYPTDGQWQLSRAMEAYSRSLCVESVRQVSNSGPH